MLLMHVGGEHTTTRMADFKFSCPHCQQHLQCREEFSGRQIQCPSCRVLIRIPAVPGQTAQFAPESGMTWATFVPGSAKDQPPEAGGKKAEGKGPA